MEADGRLLKEAGQQSSRHSRFVTSAHNYRKRYPFTAPCCLSSFNRGKCAESQIKSYLFVKSPTSPSTTQHRLISPQHFAISVQLNSSQVTHRTPQLQGYVAKLHGWHASCSLFSTISTRTQLIPPLPSLLLFLGPGVESSLSGRHSNGPWNHYSGNAVILPSLLERGKERCRSFLKCLHTCFSPFFSTAALTVSFVTRIGECHPIATPIPG